MNFKNIIVSNRFLSIAQVVLIVLLAAVPLFFSFPYRVNIFLSWEGAYRISQGELPFRDFGTPLGGMYWIIPGIFFKIFGPQMITLVKAQVFINIISGLAFRSILKSMGVNTVISFIAVLLFCLSFSFFNFWPWYNNTVIVYELIGFAFLFKALLVVNNNRNIVINIILASLFITCSFLTKQDAGAMAVLLGLAFTFYVSVQSKKWLPLISYLLSFGVILSLFIISFVAHDFGYWFNHGQAPHSSRVSGFELFDDFFSGSQFIKFYAFLIVILVFLRFKSWKDLWNDKKEMLFLLLTLGILLEATVFQVTSYTPPDNNIFYHGFAFVYILYSLLNLVQYKLQPVQILVIGSLGILLWWSGVYWKYIHRILNRKEIVLENKNSDSEENLVNKETYMINLSVPDSNDIPESKWRFSNLKSFHKIYMPEPTIQGINRILSMDLVKTKKDLKVLNMSELTPLAVEIPYKLEKGSHYPLWYHLGVGMFNKQAEMFETKIKNNEYDLVLFEYIPSLNNFYPFRVRDTLAAYYNKVDAFPAPRRGETSGSIEVYIRR